MRVIAGPEKKTRVMSEKERLITAYHEMGHALVGHFLEHSDPVHKISVISRGQALGYTISMPQEDRFLTTRAELKDTMAMTLGGRAAEEIVFGEITTGASNDIEKVTADRQADGDALRHERQARPARVRPRPRPAVPRPRVLDRARLLRRDRARDRRRGAGASSRPPTSARADILTEHQHELTKISEILVKRETIEKEEFLALLDGKSEEEVFGVEEETKPRAARAARARRSRRARSAAHDPAPRAGRRHRRDPRAPTRSAPSLA